jgi:hypothetical protein
MSMSREMTGCAEPTEVCRSSVYFDKQSTKSRLWVEPAMFIKSEDVFLTPIMQYPRDNITNARDCTGICHSDLRMTETFDIMPSDDHRDVLQTSSRTAPNANPICITTLHLPHVDLFARDHSTIAIPLEFMCTHVDPPQLTVRLIRLKTGMHGRLHHK